MKTAVLIKQVPDTETKINVKADGSGIEEAGIKYIMSPYDELAVEEAIKLGGETVVIALGPDRVVEAIRTALAMGIQKAIHIDTQGADLDSYSTAAALAAVLKDGGYNLILCGKQAIDYNNSAVVQMVAEILGLPHVTVVEKLEVQGDKAKITRKVSGAQEIYETKLPAVIGCEKGLNTPRYASLPGIMKAKTKPVEKKIAKDLLGGATPLVTLKNFALPPEKAAGKKIAGEAAQQAAELVKLLRTEAKVI